MRGMIVIREPKLQGDEMVKEKYELEGNTDREKSIVSFERKKNHSMETGNMDAKLAKLQFAPKNNIRMFGKLYSKPPMPVKQHLPKKTRVMLGSGTRENGFVSASNLKTFGATRNRDI